MIFSAFSAISIWTQSGKGTLILYVPSICPWCHLNDWLYDIVVSNRSVIGRLLYTIEILKYFTSFIFMNRCCSTNNSRNYERQLFSDSKLLIYCRQCFFLSSAYQHTLGLPYKAQVWVQDLNPLYKRGS